MRDLRGNLLVMGKKAFEAEAALGGEGQVTLELDGAKHRSGRTMNTRNGLVLACITRYPGRGTTEIAKRTGLREPTVSEIVSDLVEEGSVQQLKTGGKRLYNRRLAESSSH